MNEQELMQKLALSKAIMNKTESIKKEKKLKLTNNKNKIEIKNLTIFHENKTSIFPLQFLEKSIKSLDDEFFFITQNLYPDLIFY